MFCHSRWAIINNKTNKPALAKTYTAAQYVLHVQDHVDDFPTATKIFVMGTLAAEMDTSPAFCAALIDHVCQFDKKKGGQKKYELDRDFVVLSYRLVCCVIDFSCTLLLDAAQTATGRVNWPVHSQMLAEGPDRKRSVFFH